jgi:predicted O-methyltransferase YrrM
MPARILKKILKLPVQYIWRRKAKSAARELAASANPGIRGVGLALLEALEGIFTAEENAWIQKVEQRRSALLASTEVVPIVDFGAGNPDSRRSAEEMAKGVESTCRVADACAASKPAFWAKLLFKLVRHLQPSTCVELGTCVGISAAYQAAALELNGKGQLVTMEGAPEIARTARETLEAVGLGNASVVTGSFQAMLQGVLERNKPIDYFFNDGHHDHDAVLAYHKQVSPYLADGAVIVFDDISWSPGMRKAWETIEADPATAATFDLRAIGIAVTGKSAGGQRNYRLPL